MDLKPEHVLSAYSIAKKAHQGQVDKSGKPYINHPLAVALELEELGPLFQVVGVLHDVVENSDWTVDQLRELFGDEVAEAVDGLSRREGETYTEFIQRCKLNPISRIIKPYDIRHNLSRAEGLTDSHKKRYLLALEQLSEV